jgi:hypothetical protein
MPHARLVALDDALTKSRCTGNSVRQSSMQRSKRFAIPTAAAASIESVSTVPPPTSSARS